VARYFPPESRAKMEQLVENLRTAFRHRIENVDWMSPATKKEALDKLARYKIMIGYTSEWRNYGDVTIRPDDLYGDAKSAGAASWTFELGHLGKPVDRNEWGMTPQTVNAYNNPTLNEVVFPAAILQPPFFDPKADPAINYGGIVAVIGHEMTHGFDDQEARGARGDVAGRPGVGGHHGAHGERGDREHAGGQDLQDVVDRVRADLGAEVIGDERRQDGRQQRQPHSQRREQAGAEPDAAPGLAHKPLPVGHSVLTHGAAARAPCGAAAPCGRRSPRHQIFTRSSGAM
jgi:hypothetical protein